MFLHRTLLVHLVLTMFAKTFHFLLVSFVSADFNNHTVQDLKTQPNIGKLPVVDISASNPFSKNCLLIMKDSEIICVIQLTKSDSVNIVDLHLFFDNDYNNQPLGDYQISLVNPVGREIVRTLETGFRGFITWTLNAGRKSVELRIRESPRDCNKRLDVHEVASSIFKRIVNKMKEPTNYKICYTFPHRHSPYNTRRCKPDDFTKLDWDSSLMVVTYTMFILFPLYFSWLLFSLLSYAMFDIKYPKYSKLEESPMSPTSVLLKLFWKEKGCVISFFRRSVTMCFLTYIVCCYIPKPVSLFRYTRYLVLYSTASIPFSRVFLKPMLSSVLEKKAKRRLEQSTPSFFCEKFGNCVNCLTLPFNFKFWKNVLTYFECDVRRRQPARKSLKSVGIFFLCICILFPLLLIAQSLYFCCQTFTILKLLLELGYTHADTKPSWKKEMFICLNNGLTTFSLLILLFHILFILVLAIQSFFLGLFLNLSYFTPYLAFASVLTFYFHSSWKSLEEKYLVLKRVVYDVCQERQKDMRETTPSCSPGQNEVALPVVSKEVYEIAREKFLPYHTNISFLILKLLCAFAFSFALFVLINMLHDFHITATIQVITTASLGIMPHVFNMVASKTSEEREKAWIEKLKLNVKYLVEEQTTPEDPDRVKTVLIIQDSDDSVAENIRLLKRCTQPKAAGNEANNEFFMQQMNIYINNVDGYV